MTLPNGNSIDLGMLETAMEDSDVVHRNCLNLVSGEVLFFSDRLDPSEEDERLSEEIDGSNDYVATQHIPSYLRPDFLLAVLLLIFLLFSALLHNVV
jgi:hypothetical protein